MFTGSGTKFCTLIGVCVLSLALGLGATRAGTRTIHFTATDFVNQSGDVFGPDGFGFTAPKTVTGSFSFDTTAAPVSGPDTFAEGTDDEVSQIGLPYVSFTVTIGAISIVAPNTSAGDRITLTDASGYGAQDNFGVMSTADQSLGLPSGAILDAFAVFALGADNTHFSGVEFPTVAELNSLDADFPASQGVQLILKRASDGQQIGDGIYESITFSEGTAASLPVASPILSGGLVLLGLVGWRRRLSTSV